MSDPLDQPSPGAMLDLSNSPPSYPRRIRPPGPQTETGEAVRVPLRAEVGDKARKRESRLGLRNIFGRARGGSEADRAPPSPRDAPSRPGGIRASLAEINWPYGLNHAQGHRSETTLPSFSKSLPAGQALKHKKSESVVRQPPSPEGIAAWNPPPLFQAYPQAIKHAHLPACTVPADVVLRLHNHKSSGSLAGLLSPSTSDIPEEMASEKPKRRHRRNGSGSASRFEWTTKVFVLATSGYLLQYAGEGSFDRLPERVLQLGKDSAAFASDAIPGRHWVIQVSSAAEPDRTPGSHAASLRARLPFRGQERRYLSTFLMVFESAEEMDGWIATLRREIETLGGRKVLSETGKPKISSPDARLRSQASQRTLVMKDPDRFSRVLSPDQAWNQSLPIMNPDIHYDRVHEDPAREQSFDDTSTASFISHEGRQLDALRDSTHRLSFMSSGQRTMVTSVGSSPACSPIRDSFGEFETMPEVLQFEEQSQPRRRPNAMAIIDRRQSLQAINHAFEMRLASAQGLRPVSTYSNSGQPEAATTFASAPQSMPNFSVPHHTSKRHSFARTPLGMPPTQVTTSPLFGRMSARRPPPSALSINPRPLSLVEDQPSPALSSLSRAGTATGGTGSPLSATPITPPISTPPPQRVGTEMRERMIRYESIRDSGIATQENTPDVAAHMDQKLSTEPADGDVKGYNALSSPKVSSLVFHDMPRSTSSLGTCGEFRVGPQAAAKQGVRIRTQSFGSAQQAERSGLLAPPRPIRPDHSQRPHTPSFVTSVPRSSQHLRLDSESQAGFQRRSMSHLADGPPPAPPPNRALPPIPPKARVNVVPPPGFI
ncbi:hypothetical protein C8A00DRAFT_44209 [Chaetomidium leptoderma]|uniref:PH domain-containing protein n=1 Tax=Chaetomidium leptoderma TaxID=669021 RepID=A0AAN6ZUU5_9PEZI|nr:hypothetical protein C8A00DRAFT_44209 [Chaetomidium leptoderma]